MPSPRVARSKLWYGEVGRGAQYCAGMRSSGDKARPSFCANNDFDLSNGTIAVAEVQFQSLEREHRRYRSIIGDRIFRGSSDNSER